MHLVQGVMVIKDGDDCFTPVTGKTYYSLVKDSIGRLSSMPTTEIRDCAEVNSRVAAARIKNHLLEKMSLELSSRIVEDEFMPGVYRTNGDGFLVAGFRNQRRDSGEFKLRRNLPVSGMSLFRLSSKSEFIPYTGGFFNINKTVINSMQRKKAPTSLLIIADTDTIMHVPSYDIPCLGTNIYLAYQGKSTAEIYQTRSRGYFRTSSLNSFASLIDLKEATKMINGKFNNAVVLCGPSDREVAISHFIIENNDVAEVAYLSHREFAVLTSLEEFGFPDYPLLAGHKINLLPGGEGDVDMLIARGASDIEEKPFVVYSDSHTGTLITPVDRETSKIIFSLIANTGGMSILCHRDYRTTNGRALFSIDRDAIDMLK